MEKISVTRVALLGNLTYYNDIHGGSKMIDNRKVNDNHQQGIERVKQKKSESGRTGEPGKMSGKPKEKANWKREGGAMTPRKA
jgi:hypothetical protein